MHLRLDPNGPWGGAKQQLDSLQQAKQGGSGRINRSESFGWDRSGFLFSIRYRFFGPRT